MGQRLDRSPGVTNGSTSSSLSTNVLNATPANIASSGNTAVSNSLSTTFSSSSSSSSASSSSSSSTALQNNNQANATRSSSSRHSNNRHHHHHHHNNNHRLASGSIPETTATNSNTNQPDLLNMSPRTRFRHEMARRGYTNSSSDLFFRLFQFPSLSTTSNNSSSTVSASTTTNTPIATTSNSENANNAVTTYANTGSGSGLSRFFNLSGGQHQSSNYNANVGDDLDSELSSDEDEPHWNHNLNSLARSLPFFFGMRDFKCFVCNKLIPADDVETHIMMCLTKPRLTYNDDILTEDKGECIICFEILEKGQTIARLPCLCIYHKNCIDCWLARSQCCPGHPN